MGSTFDFDDPFFGTSVIEKATTTLSPEDFHDFVEHAVSRGHGYLLNTLVIPALKISVLHLVAAWEKGVLEKTLKLFANQNLDFNALDKDGNNPLRYALECSSPKEHVFRTLIQLGADCNAVNKLNHSVFRQAVFKENLPFIRILAEEGCDLNLTNSFGNTPLLFAALNKRFKCVRELVNVGADVSIINKNGQSALHLLMTKSKGQVSDRTEILDMVKLLISKGININLRDVDGSTMLHIAPETLTPEQYHDIVVHLIEIGETSCFQIKDDFDFTPLHEAIYSGMCILAKTIELFASHGVDIAGITGLGHSLLHLASRRGNTHAIAFLLSRRELDIDAKTKQGLTPLHCACIELNESLEETIKILIENGANVKCVDDDGRNILHHAALFAVMTVNILQLVVDHGVDINAKCKFGDSPLHHAVRKQPMEIVSRMIKLGADVFSKNDHGNNLVHLAVASGDVSKVDFFLCMGLDIEATDMEGDTPLHYAFEEHTVDHYQIAELLIRKGANLNVVPAISKTTLEWYLKAVKNEDKFKSVELLRLMIDYGCNFNQKNKFDTPMLQVMSSCLSPDIFCGLLVHLVDSGKTCWLQERGHFGETLLHRIVQNMELEENTLQMLRAQGIDFNAVDHLGNSVFFYAILGRRESRFLNMLIEFGCDVNKKNHFGDTAIHFAALTGDSSVVFSVIMAVDMNVNARNIHGQSALHMVPCDGHQCTDLLLEEGADASLVDWYGKRPKIWKYV